MTKRAWESLAAGYAGELITSPNEIHFGVGIPGNSVLKLVPQRMGAQALDIGCGSGENLMALARLGYRATGIDTSAAQLVRAQELFQRNGHLGKFFRADIGKHAKRAPRYDMILSVGVAHFCPSLPQFFSACARVSAPRAALVVSVPHPLDMAADWITFHGKRQIIVREYFPKRNRITGAHYWRKFGGHLPLASKLREFICRPSDLANAAIHAGFRITGYYEPETSLSRSCPCRYRRPAAWFLRQFCRRIPQYLILCATYDR